jgi:hypothetical protein
MSKFKVGDSLIVLGDGLNCNTDKKGAIALGAKNWCGDFVNYLNSECHVVATNFNQMLLEISKGINKGKQFVFCNYNNSTSSSDFDILQNKKQKENRMKDLKKSKFMVYGTGCNNKSDMFDTRKQAEEKAKEVIYDSDWTGDIVIYEMKPLSIAEKSIKLRKV